MRYPSTQRATIKDVAKAADVSISTVSRVMNSQQGLMKDETRQRVLAAIRQLQYIPNQAASSLRNERSRTLGIVVPNILNPFFTEVIRSIQDSVGASGYEIVICNTDDSLERESYSVQALLSRRIDGLILASCAGSAAAYEQLAAQRYPLVLVDRQIPGLGCDTVVVDNIGICEKVMNKLLALGHDRIGIITPPLGSVTPRFDRIEGCRKAMRAHGRELSPNLLVEVDFHKDSGGVATARLLSQPSPPTALFVLNTFLAIGALKELVKRKNRTLEDVSFVMFDDPGWSELLSPSLTAVQQPISDIGRVAARLVMERINQPEKPFENIRLEARLVERESIKERKV